MSANGLKLHVALLAISVVVAARAWLADEPVEREATAEIWRAEPEQVSGLEYTAKDRRVVLEARTDEYGRYFVATSERDQAPAPHAEPDASESEAGEPEAGEPGAGQPPSPGTGSAGSVREVQRFIAVTKASELIEELAPLRAVRSLGKLEPARDAEFGFGEGAAKLLVQLGGQIRELSVGGKAPGGSHVYVHTSDGVTHVVMGSIARELESAESRLLQRDLHAWEPEEASAAKLVSERGHRSLVRSTADKAFWASSDAPEHKDETLGNWMKKLERLRISKYVEQGEAPPNPLFRVEFADTSGKSIGFVELASRPAAVEATPLEPREGESEPALEYLARSEHTRLWGKVITSTAEQLAQDLAALLGP